jgi:hypothetical protein
VQGVRAGGALSVLHEGFAPGPSRRSLVMPLEGCHTLTRCQKVENPLYHKNDRSFLSTPPRL